jgi:arylsulfatase A-like enzyme
MDGCTSVEPPTGVVIITLDTTRADRLSPYGFMNVSLPALEQFAREGVVFDAATSVAPLTLPAHTSLFTGLLPPRHGVRDNADPPLAERFVTLAESLAARGFRTGAFVGSIVLDPDRGLAQGFATYSGVAPQPTPGQRRRQRRGDAVVDDALEWIERVGDRPYFLWVHLYDPHRPYSPPEPYATTYSHNLYVGEIAYADSQVGRLIDGLEQRKLFGRSVVVVAGDHGESLGERGERDHGIFVYENVLRVPLMIRAPGLAAGRVDDVVRLTDVMPTIFDLLEVPAPAADLDGISLVPLMSGRPVNLDLEAFAESTQQERFGWSALGSLRVGRFKVIDAPRPELYDLSRDPFEETNIYADRQALADTMIARVAAIRGQTDSAARASAPGVSERLAALGYVAADRMRQAPGRGRLLDPKDVIHLLPQVR